MSEDCVQSPFRLRADKRPGQCYCQQNDAANVRPSEANNHRCRSHARPAMHTRLAHHRRRHSWIDVGRAVAGGNTSGLSLSRRRGYRCGSGLCRPSGGPPHYRGGIALALSGRRAASALTGGGIAPGRLSGGSRFDLGLLAATDRQIWDEAISRSAVLVTKDRDFSLRRAARNDGPAILWVRMGNISNRKLIDMAIQALPTITDAVERGEAVIELVGSA